MKFTSWTLVCTLFILTPVAGDDLPPNPDGKPLPKGALLRLGTLRFQSEGNSTTFDVSPDGSLLANVHQGYPTALNGLGWTNPSQSANRLRFWDARTGRLVHVVNESTAFVRFCPAGDLVAIGKGNGPVRLLNTTGFAEVRTIPAVVRSARQVAFTADAKTIVAPANGTAIGFWDLQTGKEIRRIEGVNDPTFVCFSPDGKRFATVHFPKGGVGIWDLATGREERRFADFTGPISSLCFAPDGKSFCTSGQRQNVTRRDIESGKTLWTADPATKNISNIPIMFSNDRKEILTGGFEGLIWLDANNGKTTRQLWAGRINSSYCNLRATNELVFMDGNVPRFFNLQTSRERFHFSGHTREVTSATFAPDGNSIVTAGGNLQFWDAKTGKELAYAEASLRARCATVSPNSQLVAVAAVDQTIRLWDAASRKPLRTFTGKTGEIEYLAFFPDGKTILSHYRYDRVSFPDGSGRQTRAKYEQVWDVETGKEIRGIGDRMVDRVALSADGRILVGGMNSFFVWNAINGTRVAEFGDRHFLHAIAVTPDNRRVVTSLADRSICVWEAVTGTETTVIFDRQAVAIAVAVSPSGRVIATGDADGVVRLYDLDDGRELLRFEGHSGPVSSVSFSNDGCKLISGNFDLIAYVWDIDKLPKQRTLEPDPKEWPALWNALASERSRVAHEAVRGLAAVQNVEMISFLREHLKKQPAATQKTIAKLIADLDSAKFSDREKASADLALFGKQAETALRKALDQNPTPELRRRADILLKKLGGSKLLPSALRNLRVVEVLERIGTSEARQLLIEMSVEDRESETEQAASLALERMKKNAR